MKQISALLSALFERKPAVLVPIEQRLLRDFSLSEAQAGAEFRLRCGKPFEVLSLDHHDESNPLLKVRIQIEGQPLPFCYYENGYWNELDCSDYDLVMAH